MEAVYCPGRSDGRLKSSFLHGDFHAITSANNLLAALLDNHIQQEMNLALIQDRLYGNAVLI